MRRIPSHPNSHFLKVDELMYPRITHPYPCFLASNSTQATQICIISSPEIGPSGSYPKKNERKKKGEQ